ncbi:MAG: ParB/RepB/Spo0J family partition protein [Arcanobacterium sp.]|nr:ParB/RepB/Spo0J family partition protein [Arcanobacterium sp.]
MADKKRRGLGSGIAALIPTNQAEKSHAIDVFFGAESKAENRQLETELREEIDSTRRRSGSLQENAHVDQREKAKKRSASDKEVTTAALTSHKGSSTPRSARTVSRETSQGEDLGSQAQKTKRSAGALDGSSSPRAKQKDKSNGRAVDVSRETSERADGLVPVPGTTYGEIPVELIIPNTKQPRSVFDEDELAELAASIKEVGVLQPVVIRPLTQELLAEYPNHSYELIMGERRWRATQLAGLTQIPAIVRRTEDEDLLRDALLENLHRVQLNALEEAAAYQQLLDDFHITQEELSKKIARSRPQISNTLRLLKLPGLVQRRVAAGVISAGHARALLGLSDPAEMERLAQRIVAEGLSVRAVEEIVALGTEKPEKHPSRRRVSVNLPELDELALRLTDKFDTRVKAQMGSRKGKLTIEFANIDDLNRILDVLGEDHITQ